MRQLLEAGVHFGHHTRRWNPKMKDYIFGVRNNTHILDLRQSVPLLHRALEAIREVTASGGRVLLVGTKRQAAEKIADTAQKTGQYFVNHRWLGGMLTNWKTISNSIKRYKKLTIDLKKENTGFTKKENLKMGIQRDKLERSLGGIADMKKFPEMIFIIDTNVEDLAVKEAVKLNIPIVAIVDTNSDPTGINFPIPGNDDARRAINLYCELTKQTILDAQKNMSKAETEDPGQQDKSIELNKDDEKKEQPKKKAVKKEQPKKKEKIKTAKKISKSIISKVKELALKKSK